MNINFALFVIILVKDVCCFQTFGNVQRTSREFTEGNFIGLSDPTGLSRINYDILAYSNVANTTDGVANAGNRFFTSRDADIYDSNIRIDDRAFENFAQSQGNTAVSGSQTVIANISDSVVVKNTYVDDNVAIITSTNNNAQVPQAIAGSQTQVGSLANSIFQQEKNMAVSNLAVNQAGVNSIAGTETSFGDVKNSSIFSYDYAGYNIAENVDGPATSGVEFGANSVENSNITLRTKSYNNFASSINAPAVAGVEQSFGSVRNSTIDIEVATGCKNPIDPGCHSAIAQDNGKAISGLVSAFESVENSTVEIDVDAYNNNAYAYGASDTPKDSVAGASITVNSLENSKLNITANTGYNYAFNNVSSNSNNNNAISGVDIVVGQGKDSQVNVDLSSKGNTAYAVNGDAVAGNRVQVLNNENTTVTYNNNYAIQNDGASIFGSFIGK